MSAVINSIHLTFDSDDSDTVETILRELRDASRTEDEEFQYDVVRRSDVEKAVLSKPTFRQIDGGDGISAISRRPVAVGMRDYALSGHAKKK